MSRFWWIRRLFRRARLTIRRPVSAKFQVLPLEERLAPAWLGGLPVAAGHFDGDRLADIVTGSTPGSTARVTVRSTDTGNVLQSFLPFGETFKGGASVAVTLPDATGTGQVLVGAGPGGGPHVRMISTEGIERKSFFAFAPSFTGGVSVASGDFDQDGVADLVVAAGQGGGPHVRVLNGMTGSEILGFYAYSPDFTGGVTVTTADLTGDGIPELITGAGVGGGPHVRVFDGQTGAALQSFYAYDSSFRGGVSVSAGDVDGDGVSDIVTSPGAGGGPHVRAFTKSGQPIAAYMAFAPEMRGGVSVASGDLDGDGRADLVVGDVSVRVLDARSGEVKVSFTAPASDYAAIRVPGSGGAPVAVQLTQLDDSTIFRNEFGVFPVDDAAGRINGLLPSAAGYAAAALDASRAKAFFQARSSIATEEISLP
ncbi:MAG: FG-GAP repeat domain-containing protein, partial [Fimbriiglobus sp.]